MTPVEGVEDDQDVEAALKWLASNDRSPGAFWERLRSAQNNYRELSGLPENFGRDLALGAQGNDVVGAFLAQAKSLLDDRRSYDLALGSQAVPWLKQIGKNVQALDGVHDARARAARMLQAQGTCPDSAIFELVMAANYAAAGFDVAFMSEARGAARTPDLRLSVPGGGDSIFVECKRLQRGKYELSEQARHRQLFREAATLINARKLSIHIDTTYTSELQEVPDTYLADRLMQALSSRVLTLGAYPWRDKYGYGEIRPANLTAVRQDIRESSLYFGTKLARLLCGHVVKENCYHLAANCDPDSRDPRYIEAIQYASVATWQCVAPGSIETKARFVTTKLAEADEQLSGHGPGVVHIAMNAELQSRSSDLRRDRNIAAIKAFLPNSMLMAIYLHYWVPRISEVHSWLVDETVDRFGPGFAPVPSQAIFPAAAALENDAPAWKQDISLHVTSC